MKNIKAHLKTLGGIIGFMLLLAQVQQQDDQAATADAAQHARTIAMRTAYQSFSACLDAAEQAPTHKRAAAALACQREHNQRRGQA